MFNIWVSGRTNTSDTLSGMARIVTRSSKDTHSLSSLKYIYWLPIPA